MNPADKTHQAQKFIKISSALGPGLLFEGISAQGSRLRFFLLVRGGYRFSVI